MSRIAVVCTQRDFDRFIDDRREVVKTFSRRGRIATLDDNTYIQIQSARQVHGLQIDGYIMASHIDFIPEYAEIYTELEHRMKCNPKQGPIDE